MTSMHTIIGFLRDQGIEWDQVDPNTIVAVLPGTHKQRISVSLSAGASALVINAFVARHPDENHEAVYRWLLERNRRQFVVAFSLDHLGDIYLTGRIPLAHLTESEFDAILGSVLEYADNSFNSILELGFASAIAKEWTWRTSRGLPTDNLAAFRHLATGNYEQGSEK